MFFICLVMNVREGRWWREFRQELLARILPAPAPPLPLPLPPPPATHPPPPPAVTPPPLLPVHHQRKQCPLSSNAAFPRSGCHTSPPATVFHTRKTSRSHRYPVGVASKRQREGTRSLSSEYAGFQLLQILMVMNISFALWCDFNPGD